MPSYIKAVDGKPIILSAFLHKTSYDDLQEAFIKIRHLVQKNREKGQTWLILDLTSWDVTREDLAGLVGAMASRVPGSPYDTNVVPLLVSPNALLNELRASLTDHKASFEMLPFDNLDQAYHFALGNLH